MTASSTGRSSAGMTDRSSSGLTPTSSLGVTTTFTSAEMSLRNESNNHSQYFQQRSPGFLSDPTAAAAMHNNSGPSSSELLAASRKSPYQSHHFPRYQGTRIINNRNKLLGKLFWGKMLFCLPKPTDWNQLI